MTLREIKKRWKAETPFFFKKVIAIGSALITISVALLGSQYFGILPFQVQTVAGYVFTIGIVMSSVGKLAVKDPKDAL